mmetsp:Transcript_56911/g.127087  ORF Transcript_56911/g.127087 Transcript_56911/m.127087 type:complete len:178 (-) Transcript_56911:310-843(-)
MTSAGSRRGGGGGGGGSAGGGPESTSRGSDEPPSEASGGGSGEESGGEEAVVGFGRGEAEDGLGETVVEEWEEAAAKHTAERRPKNSAAAARRTEAKNAQKEHKRRVKAEARAKREGSSLPAARYHASPPNRVKRASVRTHRDAAPADPWEKQWRQLEDLFGIGLAGLSGLVLADED